MSKKNFTAKLFIDIGETAAYFTLRETYLHTTYIPGEGDMGNSVVNGVYQGTTQTEVRSFHLFNLSQDINEALEKAKEYSEKVGTPLMETDGYLLASKMREIKRETKEAKEQREREYAENEARWGEERKARLALKLKSIEEGVFPFGQYEGKSFDEVDLGYINWILDKESEFEEDSLMRMIAVSIREKFPHLRLPKCDQTAFIGEVKQRIEVKVRVVRLTSFDRGSYSYGQGLERVWVTTMRKEDTGECIVCLSSSFRGNVGEVMTIKATVKEHNWYGDQAQTIVQRVAVVNN